MAVATVRLALVVPGTGLSCMIAPGVKTGHYMNGDMASI